MAKIPGKVRFETQPIIGEIERETREYMRGLLQSIIPELKIAISTHIREALYASVEYQTLLADRELQGFLGLTDVTPILEQIIGVLSNSVDVYFRNTVLFVNINPGDFGSILSIPGGSFISEGGFEIPWLRWLLTAGSNATNPLYSFVGGDFQSSRTGYGVMFPVDVIRNEGIKNIPPGVAGTINNNWITRALSTVEPQIVETLEKLVISRAT